MIYSKFIGSLFDSKISMMLNLATKYTIILDIKAIVFFIILWGGGVIFSYKLIKIYIIEVKTLIIKLFGIGSNSLF